MVSVWLAVLWTALYSLCGTDVRQVETAWTTWSIMGKCIHGKGIAERIVQSSFVRVES